MTRASDPSDVDVRDSGSLLLPTRVTPWVRRLAVASLVANALLILTGGLVRLTGSGLGCPTWPMCTDESWTNTPEMGMHGVIEFGNRLLTFVLALVAVLTFLSVLRLRHRHRDLFLLALLLGLGIPLQAVVGGIVVHTGLNPWLVGVHYLLSSGMIALATVLVNRTRRADACCSARHACPCVAWLRIRFGKDRAAASGRFRPAGIFLIWSVMKARRRCSGS